MSDNPATSDEARASAAPTLPDEAVVVGVAAFHEGAEPPSDDEVFYRLRTAGVQEWLAERLVAFLPLAFGRRVLPGVTLADTFIDGDSADIDGDSADGDSADSGSAGGGTERLLASEPVFLAAAAAAEIAGRDDIERIGLRSAEFHVVNQALHAGAQMTDLVVKPIRFPDPLPPVEDGDGGVPSPAAIFADFLRGHGLPVEGPEAGRLRVGEASFSARLIAHPSPLQGVLMAQVDVAVDHPEMAEPWMVESCAGVGPTWREAIHQAMVMFERGVVHPIVEALLSRGAASDQVSWEPYDHPSGAFDLCLGAQLTLFTADPVPSAEPLLDRLLTELREVPLSRAVHALRVFTCHRDGELVTNELLLDGEPWEPGARVVAATPPPLPTGMVGQRLFGLLVPAT
jgi:hypothetical protein